MNSHKLKYLPLTLLLHLLALLPLWLLYRIADIIGFALMHVIKYRRQVVEKNLMLSFPNLNDKERNSIARKFYLNLADEIVETVKLLHISDRQMHRRMTFNPSDIEMIDKWMQQGRPVVACFSHCFNWEWAPSITLWSRMFYPTKTAFCQIYRPLRNRWADKLMLQLRSRFGAVSIPKKVAFLDLLRYRRQGITTITGFMCDQHPSSGDPGYITTFMHQPTAMITGTETVARRLDAAVVYWDMHKPSRGHYHIDMRLITENPASMPQHAITAAYTDMLQETIMREPAGWLWSHNRWKKPVAIP